MSATRGTRPALCRETAQELPADVRRGRALDLGRPGEPGQPDDRAAVRVHDVGLPHGDDEVTLAPRVQAPDVQRERESGLCSVGQGEFDHARDQLFPGRVAHPERAHLDLRRLCCHSAPDLFDAHRG